MRYFKPNLYFSIFAAAVAQTNLAHAQDSQLSEKYFIATNLPTHADGIQRFEPSNFLQLQQMNAYDLIENIVQINRINANAALVLWNGDFFKDDKELSDEILKNIAASDIKFVEIFDGEGGESEEAPNKIINLITKIYSVDIEPNNAPKHLPKLANSIQKEKPIIESKIEFGSKISAKNANIATKFDEQGVLENAKINFGEIEQKELKTTVQVAQPILGQDFLWEAKFKKKQTQTIDRKSNIIGADIPNDVKMREKNEDSLALNSVLKGQILGLEATTNISGSSQVSNQSEGANFENGGNTGVFETLNAVLNIRKDDLTLSAGAETKSLKESDFDKNGENPQLRVFQSRAFAKMSKNWSPIDYLNLKSEIGGAVYALESPFLSQSDAKIIALNSLLFAKYERPNWAKLTAKFEAKPGEYYRNQFGFILPIDPDAIAMGEAQSNRNLQFVFEKDFGENYDLQLVFENRETLNQIKNLYIQDESGNSYYKKSNFGDTKYQKIAANYFLAFANEYDAKLTSGVNYETESSPNTQIGGEILYGETKRKNYQLSLEAKLPNDNGNSPNLTKTWGAGYELNSIQYFNALDQSSNINKSGHFGVFVNFDYGEKGAFRAEVNSPLLNDIKGQIVDKSGNYYSAIEFLNPEKPKIRLIYMKKM